jgi:hypothetical protein
MIGFIDAMLEELGHITEDMKILRDRYTGLQHELDATRKQRDEYQRLYKNVCEKLVLAPDLTKVNTRALFAEFERRINLIEGEL